MTARTPSRLALALFDWCVPPNDPLRGDLLEEFQVRRSQAWLWRQVAGAIVCQLPRVLFSTLESPTMLFAIVALLGLISFEIVFVANSTSGLLFGPPPQDIKGYIHALPNAAPSAAPAIPFEAWGYRTAAALALSVPIGWWLSRDEHCRPFTLAVVTALVVAWTLANLKAPFLAQFASMFALVCGFLAGSQMHLRRAPSES